MIMAARYGIPAFILMRPPRAAVASLLVYDPSRKPHREVLKWIRFYEQFSALRENHGFRLLLFEDVIAFPLEAGRSILSEAGITHSLHADTITSVTRDERAEKHRSSVPTREKEQRKQATFPLVDAVSHLDDAQALYQNLVPSAWRFAGI